MSWLQWRGEVWPATEAEADLHLHLWAPDSACPRQSWRLELHDYPQEIDESGESKPPRWAGVDVALNLQLDNWHDLAAREIRADPAWHNLHESTNEYGHLDVSEATLVLADLDPERRAPGEEPYQNWVAHDFIVRLGAGEGFVIPVELDAWMILDDAYYRLKPESEGEVQRFAEGPPNLHAMARARFKSCSVVVERCEDPIPRAREYLRRAIGLDLPSNATAEVNWDSYRKLPNGKSERRPGWTSRVRFDLPEQ